MKKVIAAILAAVLMVSVTACGSNSKLAERAGDYELFAVYFEEDNIYLDPAALEMPATLSLTADGKGELVIADEPFKITKWDLTGDEIDIQESGETIHGVFEGDVMNLDFEEGNFLLFAQEGTDTSSYEVLSLDDYMDFLMGQ